MFREVFDFACLVYMNILLFWIIRTGAHKRWAQDLKQRYREKVASEAPKKAKYQG